MAFLVNLVLLNFYFGYIITKNLKDWINIRGFVMINITSSQNAKYKYFKSLEKKKTRYLQKEYSVEGIKSVNDAINSGKTISAVIVADDFYVTDYDAPTYKLPRELFNKLSDTKTPQGIMAIIKMDADNTDLDITKSYVYCDNVSDPGNLGTIIRTADASGMGGVILSGGSVDVYAPKTVRASMGSFFNVDIIMDKGVEDIKKYKEMGYNLISGILSDDTIDFKEVDYTLPTIIVVGNEANGVSDELRALCTPTKIPIYGKAESLNVSVAAALYMYEWARNQKRK